MPYAADMSTTTNPSATARLSAKERYRSFIARHEVAWELFFAGLAVLFVRMTSDHSTDLADQLEHIATQHADGSLTDDEYLIAKAPLIGLFAAVAST